jgi:riboflavin kinase/FMN adenylyltransferase
VRVFRGLPNAESRAPCALTIGNFDGVHRGHQALLAHVRAAADARGLPVCVMTFEPHPREFFNPAGAPPRIAMLRDKLEALRTNGVDRVVVEHFNKTFAGQSPDTFVKNVIVDGLHARWVMVGDDFCYGAKRAGNFDSLKAAGDKYGFEVEQMATVAHPNGARISSSSVRTSLVAGDLDAAQVALGRPYIISGHVVHGLADEPLPAVASLGLRPTVDDSGRVLLEVFVLDWHGDAYGKLVRVEFLKKLRDEEKYVDLEKLSAAIAKDVDNARAYFGLPPASNAGSRATGFAISATDRIR